jgi:hypothetical protein
MSDAILVFNAGSPSIKCALFESYDRGDPRLFCKDLLDEGQDEPRLIVNDAVWYSPAESVNTPVRFGQLFVSGCDGWVSNSTVKPMSFPGPGSAPKIADRNLSMTLDQVYNRSGREGGRDLFFGWSSGTIVLHLTDQTL